MTTTIIAPWLPSHSFDEEGHRCINGSFSSMGLDRHSIIRAVLEWISFCHPKMPRDSEKLCPSRKISPKNVLDMKLQ